ncbi:MAG: hypothetical protein AABY40_04735 [Nanoarchaeota archaeon]
MNQEKELPGNTLPNRPGMRLYHGYMEGNFRYRAYVPTNIYCPQTAVIAMYKLDGQSESYPDSPEVVVTRRAVRLNSMPRWDEVYQAITLSRRDEKRVTQECRKLERNASRLEKKLRE